MGPLRWKYRIQINLEKTEQNAKAKGLSVRSLEGQSRTIGEPFPLNQTEIRSDNFNPNFRVVVGCKVTQIYFSIKEMSSMDELENMLDNLDNVENILNNIVIFTPSETSRFNMKTRKPVMSIGMLKTQKMLHDGFNDVIQMYMELAIKEFSKANISLAQGKIVPPQQLNTILSDEKTDWFPEYP